MEKPGICKISTPIKRSRKTEKTIKRMPEMAEVMISLPSFIFSGLPPAKMMVIPPQRERRKAMPPPMMIAWPRTHLTSSWGSVGIGPRPVSTVPVGEVVVEEPPLELEEIQAQSLGVDEFPPGTN